MSLQPISRIDAAAVCWTNTSFSDDRVIFRAGHVDDVLVAEWIGVGQLIASRDGTWHRFDPDASAHPAVVRKVSRGAVRGMVAYLNGAVCLHAAAVSIGGRALAVLGAAGAGKSTLAAELCARADFELLSDDVLIVDMSSTPSYALPTEDSHWLDAQSLQLLHRPAPHVERKSASAPARVATHHARLSALVHLVYDDSCQEVSLALMRGSPAFSAINASMIRFIMNEPDSIVSDLDRVTSLVRRPGLYELRRPRVLDGVGRSADALVSLLERTRCRDDG